MIHTQCRIKTWVQVACQSELWLGRNVAGSNVGSLSEIRDFSDLGASPGRNISELSLRYLSGGYAEGSDRQSDDESTAREGVI